MAQLFNKTAELVDRIPTLSATQLFFRSLVARLTPEDQELVLADLVDQIPLRNPSEQVEEEKGE